MKPVKLRLLAAVAFAALGSGCLIVSENQEAGACYEDCYDYQVCETYCDWWRCWDECWYETSCTTYCPDTVETPLPSVECYSAIDCGTGEICVNDYCRPRDTEETGVSGLCQVCETNADCGEPGALCIRLNFDQATTTGESVCGRTCEYNHECPAGFECINIAVDNGTGTAQCLPVLGDFEKRTCNPSPELECVRATDCAVGESCVNNSCKAPAEAECSSNKPCPSGQECRNFACVAANVPECTTRTDCASGELCIDGNCEAAAVACVFNAECDGGRCVDGQCRSTCSEDSQCANNERCRAGLCEPLECRRSADCGAGEICVDAQCFDTCVASTGIGCDAGYKCNNNGYCDVDPTIECRSNAECGDEICQAGTCINPCTCNQDCSTGEVCNLNSGVCEAAGAPITSCEDSCDCPSGKTCTNGTCG